MARPVKETPILFGSEARRFEKRMQDPPRADKEKMEKMKRDYDFIMSIFEHTHSAYGTGN